MKRIAILGISAILFLVGFVWGYFCENKDLSDVALANIEAIASGEGIPQAPCSENKFHECTFNVMNPNGEVGSLTLAGYIKVEK